MDLKPTSTLLKQFTSTDTNVKGVDVHILVAPSLGLVVISDIEDFGGSWLKVQVLRGDVEIVPLIDVPDDVQQVTRYLVDIMRANIRSQPQVLEPELKAVVNISLRQEICSDAKSVRDIGESLAAAIRSLYVV